MSLSSFELLTEKIKTSSNKPKKEPDDNEDEKFKISLAFQNLTEFDFKLIPENRAQTIRILDLTENNFNGLDMRFLADFTNLKTLILDKNQIESKFLIPLMPSLETLWVNHNKIENLIVFIQYLRDACPNLVYLSMLNNKAAPSYFNGGSINEYNDYRLYVISKLTKLQMLDSKEIGAEERMQANSVYGTELRSVSKKNSIRKKSISRRKSTQVKLNTDSINETHNQHDENNGNNPMNFLPTLETTTEAIEKDIDNLTTLPPELTDNILDALNNLNKISQPSIPPPSPPPFLLPPPPPPPPPQLH